MTPAAPTMKIKEKKMITIAINSLSGGQGKTFVAQLLSLLLQESGPTLAIDGDPQANLTLQMGVNLNENEPSCYELLTGGCEPQDCIYQYALDSQVKRENLFVVPSDDGLEKAQEFLSGTGLSAVVLKQRLGMLKNTFDYCVVDSPPAKSHLSLAVMGSADYILVPTESSVKGLNSLDRTLEAIDRLKMFTGKDGGGEVLGVVPFRDKWVGNSQTKKSKAAIEMIQVECEERGIHLFPSILESEQCIKAANAGLLPSEIDHPKLQYPLDKIVERIKSLEKAKMQKEQVLEAV